MSDVDIMITDSFFVLLFLLGNGGCAGVTERRQLHIFFALCLRVCFLCDFRLHLCVSFVGLYALWLVFSTVSAYIFKAALNVLSCTRCSDHKTL